MVDLLETRRVLAAAFANVFIPDREADNSIQIDVDRDGRLDIIAVSKHSVTLHHNLGDRTLEKIVTMPYQSNGNTLEQILKFDIDHDGVEDAVAVFSAGITIDVRQITLDGMQVLTYFDLDGASQGVAAGDFNGDGNLDLVTSQYAGTSIRTKLWTSSATGIFTLSGNAIDVAGDYDAVDVEGDGDLDLVSYSGWRENLGNNAFASFVTLPPAPGNNTAGRATFSDLDNDGDMDFVLPYRPTSSGGGISTLDVYARGPAGLTLSKTINVGTTGAISLLTHDLDRDGDVDFLVANKIYLNDGNLNFQFDRYLTASNYPYQPHVADIDDDGKLDVVAGMTGGLAILWGGTNRLDEAYTERYGALFSADNVDYDADGYDDLIGPLTSVTANLVRYTNANGTFRSVNFVGSPTLSYYTGQCVADFNHDGKDDMVFSTESKLLIYLGNGTTLSLHQQLVAPANSFNEIAAYDYDQDGDVDLVYMQSGTKLQLIRNDGSGTFSVGPQIDMPVFAYHLVKGDFDGNGREDLALASNDSIVIGLNLGGDSLTFGPTMASRGVVKRLAVLRRSDSNRDDLVVGTSTELYMVTLDSLQGQTVSTIASGGVADVIVRNLDAVGGEEIVVGLSGVPIVAIYKGDAVAGFESTLHPIAAAPHTVLTTDFDRDGDLDVVAWCTGGNGTLEPVTVIHNQANQDISIPQLAISVSYDNASAIVVTFVFSEAVAASLSSSDFRVQNAATGQLVTLPTTLTASAPNTYRLSLTRTSLSQARYDLSVLSGAITDSTGNEVAPQVVPIYNLNGDIDHDGSVGFGDLLILAQNYGKTGQTYSQGNLNFSTGGLVDFDDLLLMAQVYGHSVFVQATSNSRRRSTYAALCDD